jgi:hypothetical protein
MDMVMAGGEIKLSAHARNETPVNQPPSGNYHHGRDPMRMAAQNRLFTNI